MTSLPRFAVLKSTENSKFLEYVEEEGQEQGYGRCSGGDVRSPLSKFEVERAAGDSTVVHLLCCYNGKYLVASPQQPLYVAAEADKPEEDRSKSSCTLFQPIAYASGHYDFKHINSGIFVSLGYENPGKNCLYLGGSFLTGGQFTVVNWKTLVALPQYVAFKGDDGNYLCPYDKDWQNYLKFGTSDKGDSTAAHEVFPAPDGSIRLKSTHLGKFWRRSPNWIWADSSDTSTNDKDTHFWPVRVDEKTIALRNMGNNQFCKRLTADGKESCLNAGTPTVSKEARLELAELVLNRDIYNVQFHPARARMYNEHVAVMGSGQATNPYDTESSMEVKVARVESVTRSWSGSVNFTLGVTTTLVTKVPFIFEGQVEISTQLSTEYTWGEERTTEDTIEVVRQVTVPPRTRVTVYAVGTTASCDIPYSYTQDDTFMNGDLLPFEKADGIYVGVHSFNVTFEEKHEPI